MGWQYDRSSVGNRQGVADWFPTEVLPAMVVGWLLGWQHLEYLCVCVPVPTLTILPSYYDVMHINNAYYTMELHYKGDSEIGHLSNKDTACCTNYMELATYVQSTYLWIRDTSLNRSAQLVSGGVH